MKRVRLRDCVYWGWGPFWALVVQILIWWPIVELVVRIVPSNSRVGSNPLFYMVLFSLPFIGIAVNFCLFRFFASAAGVRVDVTCCVWFYVFVWSFSDAFSWYVDARFWICSVWVVSGYFIE